MESYIEAYMGALIKEFRVVTIQFPKLLFHTLYFGGGTPSLIPAKYYQQLMKEIRNTCDLTGDCEITLETNPGTLSLTYLEQLREAGINRLSMGVQSTDTFDLKRLDRIHTINDVLSSFRDARRAGFTNINLDMIFALPWQDLSGWRHSLDRALMLQPEHFSLYSLIVEPGTPLYHWYQKGWIETQNEDLEADMYEYAMQALKAAGYEHYEISNWAKSGEDRDFQSRHNRQYWLNQSYFGFGAGAHGYVKGIRTVNIPLIPDYIEKMRAAAEEEPINIPASPAAISSDVIDEDTQMQDEMMLGLRLVRDGVGEDSFRQRYGRSMLDVFGEEITQLEHQGLVEWVEGAGEKRLRLTHRGIFLANRVFREFI
jgi:oxygen-independent coproporphyrinogen-3 oxidase